MVPDLINELRRQIEELEREVADLTRQNEQLREAVAALLSPNKVSADFTGRTPRWSFNR
jgi:chaperonin cofactor prefoldin